MAVCIVDGQHAHDAFNVAAVEKSETKAIEGVSDGKSAVDDALELAPATVADLHGRGGGGRVVGGMVGVGRDLSG